MAARWLAASLVWLVANAFCSKLDAEEGFHMTDQITEREWRAVACWNVLKPSRPELIPGLPGVNAQRMRDWREKDVAYRLCFAERHRFGIPGEDERGRS